MSQIVLDAVSATGKGVAYRLDGKTGAALIQSNSFVGTWELQVRMTGLSWVAIGSGTGSDQLQIPEGWDHTCVEILTRTGGTLSAAINRNPYSANT